MDVALRAVPSPRRERQSGDDRPDPLNNHQDGKHAIRAARIVAPLPIEQLAGSI
jgi:hypothetical protein